MKKQASKDTTLKKINKNPSTFSFLPFFLLILTSVRDPAGFLEAMNLKTESLSLKLIEEPPPVDKSK